MTTELKLALDACGLTQRDAAKLLNVRRDSVEKAARGKDQTPPGWLAVLRELNDKQQHAADEALAIISDMPEDTIVEFGISSDDHEAQSLGWPCVGAHRTVARILWETGVNLDIVPRGSTLATAAAIDAHEGG